MKIKPGMLWALSSPSPSLGCMSLDHATWSISLTSNPTIAVEDNYYEKALDWDRERAQDRHNRELGWRLEFTVEPMPMSQDPITRVDLTTLDGELVTNVISVGAFASIDATMC